VKGGQGSLARVPGVHTALAKKADVVKMGQRH
jgi:hypothetical protein